MGLLFSSVFLCPFFLAASDGPSPGGNAAISAAPLILQIRVVEGDNAAYTAGTRAVRGVTVEVTDEAGKPVANAAVSFRLPGQGPTGTFANGTQTEVASTSSTGRATVWGMKWNRIPGQFAIRITAAKGETRAGAIVPQQLLEPSSPAAAALVARQQDPMSNYKIRRSRKWVWLTALAGAAAGGGLMLGSRQGGSAGAVTGTPTLTIGRPSIILGGGN
ncbi:hypothetical protein F183_A17590 [Bryobacterales bacterium F-183]|nr:hypothetical protein F183_A17590 [Bryobacterales bacterium F-183]